MPRPSSYLGVTLAAAGLVVAGCAARSGASAAGASAATAVPAGAAPAAHVVATVTTVTTAGARCTPAGCSCREPGRDDEETAPPSEGSKRFELRLGAGAAPTSLAVTGVGTVAASSSEDKCVYLDVPAGSTHDVRLTAREATAGGGVAPVLRIAEYGPKGPYWYDVVSIRCASPESGAQGRCDRRGAEEWMESARHRKRGRVDPCGSSVVTRLGWETTGGQLEQDGGLFRDFTATFVWDVKRFATQFAPGSPECVPK